MSIVQKCLICWSNSKDKREQNIYFIMSDFQFVWLLHSISNVNGIKKISCSIHLKFESFSAAHKKLIRFKLQIAKSQFDRRSKRWFISVRREFINLISVSRLRRHKKLVRLVRTFACHLFQYLASVLIAQIFITAFRDISFVCLCSLNVH